ncbi:MAG TPA: radical SAM protein [Cyclobacteriaceae bacterium]|nr:radical SAM protein [Cyclobacteriaceae bacterium]
MNEVLITNSYFYRLDPKQWRFQQPYPPLGTLQAAAVVRNAGFSTHFFDASLTRGPGEIAAVLSAQSPDVLVIYEDGFNYLTKMCLTVMREAAFTMSGSAKKQGCIVIICSSDASDHFEKYFDHGVDYVIRGEGEESLRELLVCLRQKGDVSQLPGIAFRVNGKSRVAPPRPVLRDLDSLPHPAWDLIDLAPYSELWQRRHGYFSLNIATTRGCPYKCNWCAKPIYGNRYNSRSPEHVVAEIEFLLQTQRPSHFWMSDDIFGLKPNWILRFHELTARKRLSFRYKIQSRADLLSEEEPVKALAASGCDTVWLGAESGSQKILDAMDKGITIEQIRKATSLLKRHNIKVGYFLQFGYPGETSTDIEMTIRMVLEQLPDEIGISVSYPLPGTKFYEDVKSQLQEKQNWKDSDDLAMMYKNAFPAAYYKILQRYVHSRYRIRRGINRITALVEKPGMQAGDIRKIASLLYHLPVSLIQSYQLKRLESMHG